MRIVPNELEVFNLFPISRSVLKYTFKWQIFKSWRDIGTLFLTVGFFLKLQAYSVETVKRICVRSCDLSWFVTEKV